MGAHGYATVRLTSDEMRTEFVCIPRPITRSRSSRWRPSSLPGRPHGIALETGRAAFAASASH